MPRYLVEDFNTSCTVVDFLHACMGVSITPSLIACCSTLLRYY